MTTEQPTPTTPRTVAELIADALEGDGQRWATRDGTGFDALVSRFKHRTERRPDGGAHRVTFSDGSVITVAGDAWDYGYPHCWCWAGAGHDDKCSAAGPLAEWTPDHRRHGEYAAERARREGIDYARALVRENMD